MLADYRITVDTHIDTSKLDDFERRVKALNGERVKIAVDDSSADKAVSSINQKLKNNIKTTANVDVKINDSKLRSQMKGLKVEAEIKPEFKYTQSDLKSATKKLQSQITSAMKLTTSDNVTDAQLAVAQKHIETQLSVIDKMKNSLAEPISGKFADSLNRMADEGVRALDMISAKVQDVKRQTAEGFANQFNLGDFDKQLNNIKSSISNLDRIPQELQKSMRGLETQYQKLSNIGDFVSMGDYDGVINSVNQWKDSLHAVGNQIDDVRKQQQQLNRITRNDNSSRKLENDKKTFSLQIDNWLNNNSAAVAQFGDRLDSIKHRIADVSNSADLSALRSEFTQTTLEAKNADVAMLSFGDRLKRQIREYSSYVGIAGVFAAGSQAVRMMAQDVLEVDTAMTGLYRVTDLTAAQYDTLYSNMISASKEYGSTLTDTINATADWVRAGFDADTALGLADVTAMYQHVSDLDYSEASENLLTAYNGFKDSFETEFGGNVVASVEHIADAFNELDNQYSVTSAGLGEGLARSASALQLAGNTFEEAAA